jgi:hypothetical protein
MRNNLHGSAEVVAAALLGNNTLVNAACRVVAVAATFSGANKALVVPKVEIRFVPGSTLMYGSSLIMLIVSPRASRIAPRHAEVIPLPSEETTPPVIKTYDVICEPI